MRDEVKRKIWIASLSVAILSTIFLSGISHGFSTNISSERGETSASFYGKTHGVNSNWYVIKMGSKEEIFMDEIHVNMTYSNPAMYGWCIADRFFIINPESGDYWNYPYFGMFKNMKWYNFYLQMNWSAIDFTYNHTTKGAESTFSSSYYCTNLTLPAGEWYMVCLAAPTNRCTIRVTVNQTNANIGNTTEGSSSFLLENEDFHAACNLKSVPLSLINRGKTSVDINDTFVGVFYAPTSTGIAYTRYVPPNGTTMEALSWDIFHRFYYHNNSDFIPIFEPIWGEGGAWVFHVGMMGLNMATVNILGADVKLP